MAMTDKQWEQELLRRQQERHLDSLEANANRAQSIMIGSAGSGATEISMRNNSGRFIFGIYTPVETVELIHQLSASIGCHIHIQPRQDFASWREWKEPSYEEKLHLNGFPPFAYGEKGFEKNGLLKQDQVLGTTDKPKLEEEKENVATKKAVNKRSPKRSRSSSK
jgi:hypothetical protein